MNAVLTVPMGNISLKKKCTLVPKRLMFGAATGASGSGVMANATSTNDVFQKICDTMMYKGVIDKRVSIVVEWEVKDKGYS